MARASCLLVALLLSALVIGCGASAPASDDQAVSIRFGQAQADFEAAIAPPVEVAQASTAEVVVPAVLAIQEQIQEALPAPTAAAAVDPEPWAGAAVASDLIVRWEVSSPAAYTRKWQGLICPGGASGPTGGIGFDFGHQTPADIRMAWGQHAEVERLATASGVVGDANCRAWVSRHQDIRIPYALAYEVFQSASLPAYRAGAERALGEGWHRLTPFAQAGNTSLGYNRGWSMRGDRNREKRAIRDDCAPRGDVACNAGEIRAMKRLWPNVRGLRDRREDEARTVERTS